MGLAQDALAGRGGKMLSQSTHRRYWLAVCSSGEICPDHINQNPVVYEADMIINFKAYFVSSWSCRDKRKGKLG